MPPTRSVREASGRSPWPGPDARRAGYSLVETMVALFILAGSAAIVLPRGAQALEQARRHAVFLDLQRQISDLRLEAFESETALIIAERPGTGGELRRVTLEPGWSYRFSGPLRIDGAGVCAPIAATLFNGVQPVMHLRSASGDCRLIQVI